MRRMEEKEMSQYTKKLKRRVAKLTQEIRDFMSFPATEVTEYQAVQRENEQLKEQLRHTNYDREYPGFPRELHGLRILDAFIEPEQSQRQREDVVLIRYENDRKQLVPKEFIMQGHHPHSSQIRDILMQYERHQTWGGTGQLRSSMGLAYSGATPDISRRSLERMRQALSENNNSYVPERNWVVSYDDEAENKEYEERLKQQQERDEKAMQLLKEKIGDELYKSLIDNGCFDVEGKEGIYRFYKSDKVELIQVRKFIGDKERKLTWSLCIKSTVRDMPIGDVILARYLQLKTDEAEFINIANFRKAKSDDEYEETDTGIGGNGYVRGMTEFGVGSVGAPFIRANLA